MFKKISLLCIISTVLSLSSGHALAQSEIDATASSQVTPPASSIVLKRKVGIARFSNETQSGTTFLVDDSGDRIGKQAADILSARLAETGKFMMFERLDADEVSAEQVLAGIKEAGVSIDYLIIGSVSEYGRSVESESGVFQRKKIQRAYCKVNVRLIDVETGRIIFATEGAGEASSEAKRTLGVGTSAGYDQSLTDKAISAAISQLTSKLVENMTNDPWRSYLLAEDNGYFIIAGGESQGLVPGLRLFLYRRGRTIKNPQTGAMIELPGQRAAELEVLYSVGSDEFNELSYVSVLNGQPPAEDYESYYVSDK